MLEYMFVVLLFAWAVWYLYRRLRNSFRDNDCGCGCEDCAMGTKKSACPGGERNETEGKN